MTDNVKQKILIVGDVSANAQELIESLKSPNYDMVVATTGESALDLAISTKLDLILLDMTMPEINGYEVCAKLKAETTTQRIPVMFFATEEEDETKGLEVGAIDYITKPIRVPLVKARVNNYLMLKKQSDILEHLSFIDSLTGIPNRRRFDEFLEHEWRRAIRGITHLSLIMIDIDHFQLFNEHYGYVAGDECLKQVASALDQVAERSTDLIAKYEGDQFACLLPLTNAKGATVMANKLRESILSENIPHAHSTIADQITISQGVATRRPYPNSSPSLLIADAKKALDEAKRRGGNQIRNLD
jgi:diguanylate cyclase (GGDEF)-like protein